MITNRRNGELLTAIFVIKSTAEKSFHLNQEIKLNKVVKLQENVKIRIAHVWWIRYVKGNTYILTAM